MEVSVEVTEGLKRRMKVEVPAERVDGEIQTRLKSMAKRVRISGFRPGKAPLKVVQQQYGGQIRQEVIGDLIQKSLFEALDQEKIRPAGTPTISSLDDESGKALGFSADFEVYPEITLASLEKVTIEKPVIDITDAELDNMIDTLRKQKASWQVVDRAAQDGDQMVIDFEGTIDGEKFSGGTAKQVPFVLGAKTFIPGFEEQLAGAKAGDERTIDVTFPEDYQSKEVAGKAATFKVNVNTVSEQVLPEVDEAFIKDFGVSSGDMEEFRNEVKANMERELEQAVKRKIKKQAMDALLETNQIEVPSALVEQETNALVQQMQSYAAQSGQKMDDISDFVRESTRPEAKRRVALGLIFAEIVKQHNLTAPPEAVREAVDKIASSYEDPQEVVNYYYGDRNRLAEIESMVVEDQVVTWVMENANVKDKKTDFKELMNRDE